MRISPPSDHYKLVIENPAKLHIPADTNAFQTIKARILATRQNPPVTTLTLTLDIEAHSSQPMHPFYEFIKASLIFHEDLCYAFIPISSVITLSSSGKPTTPMPAKNAVIRQFSPSHIIPSTDFVIQELLSNSPQGYGTHLWDCALFLSYFLLRNPHEIAKKRIIELGSGCGLLGFVCGILKARLCICTEQSGPALELLEWNLNISIAQSKSAASKRKAKNVPLVLKSEPLIWADPDSMAALRTAYPTPFELLLMADVLYNPRYYTNILDTLTALKTDTVFLAYKPRSNDEEKFWTLARDSQWTVTKVWDGGDDLCKLGMSIWKMYRINEV